MGKVLLLAAVTAGVMNLGGCATSGETPTQQDLMASRLLRDEKAILAVNDKVDGLRKLILGPHRAGNGPIRSVTPMEAPVAVPRPATLPPPPAVQRREIFRVKANLFRRKDTAVFKREVLRLVDRVKALPANGSYTVVIPSRYADDNYIAGEIRFDFMRALTEAGRTTWTKLNDETYGGPDIIVYATVKEPRAS